MSGRRLLTAALALAIAMPAHADFASLARAIDSQKGVSQVWIPFLGIARMAVRVVRPEGVHDFQLATFEGADQVDPAAIKAVVRAKIGPGYTPLVQVWSKKKSEWNFIYAKPDRDGERIELIVVSHDSADTVLVRVLVDASVVARELDEPRSVSRVAQR